MANVIWRQWTMLRLIPRHPRAISIQELRAKLVEAGYPINVRTLQRDLVTLSQEGPFRGSLQSDDAKPAGWRWSENAGLFELPTLNTATAMTFSLSERFLKEVIPPAMLAELLPYFRRAEDTLRRSGTRGLSELPDKIHILPRAQRQLPPSSPPGVLHVVYDALISGKQLMARYCGRDGDAKSMDLNPVGLLFRNGVVSVVCCKPPGKYAEFMLHRFQSAVCSSERSKAPEGSSIDAYLKLGAQDFLINKERGIRFQALFTPEAAHNLIEAPLSLDQTATPHPADGRMLIKATVADTLVFRKWLLSYGQALEVLEPPALRAWAIDTATAMCSRYNQT